MKKLRAGIFVHNKDKETVACRMLESLNIEIVVVPKEWDVEEIRQCILKKGPWLDFVYFDPHPFDGKVTAKFVEDLLWQHNRNVKVLHIVHSLLKNAHGKIDFRRMFQKISRAVITSLHGIDELAHVIQQLFPRRYKLAA